MSELFVVEFIPPRIVCFRLKSFTRAAVDEWVAYIKEHDGKLQSPLRVLYDMRDAGFPTPYTVNAALTMMKEVTVTDDMRTAYIAANRNDSTFYKVLAARMPRRVGEVRVFLDQESAIEWLLS